MRDCMLFVDVLFADVLFVGMRYAYGMREMRQSVRAINIWISHQWMALQFIPSPQSHSSLFPTPTPVFLASLHSHSRSMPPRCREFF